MIARGLRPKLSTHTQFIRGYFNSQKYEEAHKYVVESNDEYLRSVNYSSLARLYLKAGNAFKVENIIEKGLRPNHKVYTDVRKTSTESTCGKVGHEFGDEVVLALT
ncbi:hypothetical protein M5689_001361 [Euphorbia peplus]|nr:hypothetical protein M5689_001361 [Euphorbia peplus]